MGQHLDSAELIQKEIDTAISSKARNTCKQITACVLHSPCLHGVLMPTCINPSTFCLSGVLLGPHQMAAAWREPTLVG